MKLFKDSRGFVIAFGFDVLKGREALHTIAWCDPVTKSWECLSDNRAGWNELPYPIMPEFIFEVNGDVVAYQPGRCIVMKYTGAPFVWSFTTLFADDRPALQVAA